MKNDLGRGYDYDERHWRFVRSLPRQSHKPKRRIDWHGIALVVLALIVIFIGVVK